MCNTYGVVSYVAVRDDLLEIVLDIAPSLNLECHGQTSEGFYSSAHALYRLLEGRTLIKRRGEG